MGLNIVYYQKNGEKKWGVLKNEQVFPITGTYETLAEFLNKGIHEARKAASVKESGIPYHSLQLLSPVTPPAQIICQGANYSAHRTEAGLQAQRPPFNLIFSKAAGSISGPHDDILCPSHVKLLDYEVEIGLVIGQKIVEPVNVTRENLFKYVAGFVIANDVSARDVQLTEGQWFKGKSYRTFCPIGPILYLIDPDEASYIHQLQLTLSVNGEVRQSASTSQLLYKPEETLTELSTIIDFYPGDLLLTGTPGGVALNLTDEDSQLLMNSFTSFEEKVERLASSQKKQSHYLKDGDLIISTAKTPDRKIDLGMQKNRVMFLSN